MRTQRILAGLAIALVAAACGNSGSKATLSPRSTGATHDISDDANGSTVEAKVGDVIQVTLHSTYWQLATPTGGVLTMTSAPSTSAGGPGCPSMPGSGCGTVTADYRVAASGSTALTASRESCGEALRCTGSQGSWSVTIRASG